MRRRATTLVWGSAFLLYFLLVTVPSAHAYIDPQSGSYIFQVVVGGVLAGAVAVKVFWRRLWGFVTRKNARERAERGE